MVPIDTKYIVIRLSLLARLVPGLLFAGESRGAARPDVQPEHGGDHT